MFSRVFLISAVHFIVIVFISSQCECQDDDGITISLGGTAIPNHGLVITDNIGRYPSETDLTGGLKCSTAHSPCCTSSTSWHYAHTGTDIPTGTTTLSFRLRRTSGAVYLFRNSNNSPPPVANGIWRCTIPDKNGVVQTKYIGIYTRTGGRNGSLSAGSPDTIQFTMVSEDPVVFTLTFRTTGGPATYVTWTRDGVDISSLGDNCYTPSQTVVRLYTAGDYDNILTVRGRLSGVYGVSVTNDRTTTPVTATINVVLLGDGITISLGDRVIPNHGLVTTEDIGVDDTGSNLTVGLKCSTNYTDCYTSGTSTARWYFAHVNMEVPTSQPGGPNSFEVTRSGQAVYLFRNMDSTTNGIMRCQIPDSNGDLQTKYVGVYSPGRTGALSARSPGTIEVSTGSTSEDPVMFTLTFRTTGGPATYVTWTRDGVNISSLRDNRYTPSQTVQTNVVAGESVYTLGHYDNILTVSGRLSGVYGVSVTNDRTITPGVTAHPTSVIDSSQSASISLSGERSEDLTSIRLSWTLDDPSSIMSVRSMTYDLQYTVCNVWSGECGNTETMTGITDTSHNLDDVDVWTNYNFRVLANFQSTESSTYLLPLASTINTVTIQGVLAPIVPPPSELANITSVQVTWNQPEGGLAADEYVVTYRHLNGRDGQCSSFQVEDSLIVRANEQGRLYTTILHLQAYSVYTCNVTARENGGLYNTTSLNFTTNSSVPFGAPQNLTIMDSNSTSATISWDSVECIHRNGLITHYIISYGRPGETNQQLTASVTVNNREPEDGSRYMYTATGLQPGVSYTFKVAAVNDAGVGTFASVSENIEAVILPPEVTSVSELANITSVQVTWNQPEGGLAADEYVVSYRRLNGRDGQCSSFQDEDSVTVRAEGVLSNTINLHLQAYSVYAVNVASRRSDALDSASSTVRVETNSTIPSGAPQNLTIMDSTSTSVAISWDSVECIHRNGLISHYLLVYDSKNNVKDNLATLVETSGRENPQDSYTYTATGLDPSSSYLFKVAAISNIGIGPFATVESSKEVLGITTASTTAVNTTLTVGMATVVVVLLIVIAVTMTYGIILSVWVFKNKTRGCQRNLPNGTEDDDITETQSKPNEAVYDEINLSSEPPKTSMEMETCPAYDVTKTR